MKRMIRVDASKKISSTDVVAADNTQNTKEELASELLDRIEDDFSYVTAGIERLGRDGKIDTAIEIMNRISNVLDGIINDIGDSFDASEVNE